jgi:hypothetical protein
MLLSIALIQKKIKNLENFEFFPKLSGALNC